MKVHAETETQARRRHKRGPDLLAQYPGNECIRRTLRSARAPGHIDLCRTDFRGRHVETLAGAETFRLAYRVGRSDTVGGTVRCQLTFFMAADGTCRRYAHDSIGGILSAFNRRFRGIAGGVAETFDFLARVLERRAYICSLLLKPTADRAEEAFALLRFLIWDCCLVLRVCQGRNQNQAGNKHETGHERNRATILATGQSPFRAHGWKFAARPSSDQV